MDQTNQESSIRKDMDQPEKTSGESMGIGRSYECSFCKRGFTNAQALGGHMNIHRKEKAKATKQQDDHKQNQSCPKEDQHHLMSNSMYYSPISNHPSSLASYQFQFQPPNPSYRPHDHEPVGNIAGESHLGVNLSLQVGDSSVGKIIKTEEMDVGNEVDLELRLGVDHRDNSASS